MSLDNTSDRTSDSTRIFEFQSGDYLISIEAENFEEAERIAREEFPGPLLPIRLTDLLERIDKVEYSPLQITDENGYAVRLGKGHWTLISDPENEPEDQALLLQALINDARNRGVRIGTAEGDGKLMVNFSYNNRSIMRASHNELTAYCMVWLQTFETTKSGPA